MCACVSAIIVSEMCFISKVASFCMLRCAISCNSFTPIVFLSYLRNSNFLAYSTKNGGGGEDSKILHDSESQ